MQRISLRAMEPDVLFCNIYGMAQVWDKGNSWSFIGDPRTEHGFMYVFCEDVRVVYRTGEESVFPHGSLLYIPKYCEYAIEFRGTAGDCSDILVNFDIRDTAGKEYCLAEKIVCLSAEAPPETVRIMRRIESVSTNRKYPALEVSRLFYALLVKLSERLTLSESPEGDKSSVFPAVYYIDNHISENISVPDLAKMCLMSESAFRKAFRAKTGMSPARYRIHARIVKAQVLLKSTNDISIEEVAARLGFYDNSYFYKVFTRAVGKTPRIYREETKE